jgi:hypothetical protein
MNASNLFRWSGLSVMAAGILFIVIQLIHPSDVLSSVSTDRWVIVHCLGILMSVLAIFGVTGLYVRQATAAGWLGLVGYVLFSLFWIFSMAFQFIEAFVSPNLATKSPEFVEGILGIASGKATGTDMGALPDVYAVTGGMYALGGLVLGIATFRAGVLPRWAGGAVAAGAVLPIVLASLPHPLDRTFAVPMGLALAWLGYELWAERRERAAAPASDSTRSRLQQATAE